MARRRAGVPTVTVLAGPSADGARLFARWCDGRGVALVGAGSTDEGSLAWIDALGERRLRDLACSAAAKRSNDDTGERVRFALACRSVEERARWLTELWPDAESPEALVCRALLDAETDSEERLSGRLLRSFVHGPAGASSPEAALSRALEGLFLLSSDLDATLLLIGAPATPGLLDRWEEHAAAAAALVMRTPAFPVVVLAPGSAARTLRDGPSSRVRSLLIEGIVEVPAAEGEAPSAEAAVHRIAALPEAAPGAPTPEANPSARGAAEIQAREIEDEARSAAERFLFEQLSALPETAGLFELNRVVEGQGRWEVDLLARGPRVAIEIDGYYHFRDPDAYRVDRRKDLFLQQQGYLVLRFLAADVVSRLEEILAAVTSALRGRRETENPNGEAKT